MVKQIPSILEKKFSNDSLESEKGMENPVFAEDSDNEKTSSSNPAISSPSSFATASDSKMQTKHTLKVEKKFGLPRL